MSEWWTYTLSDFLLFSPRVYYRLFELHNRALWPAQILTAALGIAVIYMLLRPARGRERLIPAIFGVLWIWIAWSFFGQRYATVNWAATYVGPFYALEGLLLIFFAVGGKLAFTRSRDVPYSVAIALYALAVIGYPLIAPLMQRPLAAAEVFGIAPDPTAVATLALLALAQGRVRWLLMIVPFLWCVTSGATLWTMHAGDFFVAALGALLAVGLATARK
jgi:hypothetical protein